MNSDLSELSKASVWKTVKKKEEGKGSFLYFPLSSFSFYHFSVLLFFLSDKSRDQFITSQSEAGKTDRLTSSNVSHIFGKGDFFFVKKEREKGFFSSTVRSWQTAESLKLNQERIFSLSRYIFGSILFWHQKKERKIEGCNGFHKSKKSKAETRKYKFFTFMALLFLLI